MSFLLPKNLLPFLILRTILFYHNPKIYLSRKLNKQFLYIISAFRDVNTVSSKNNLTLVALKIYKECLHQISDCYIDNWGILSAHTENLRVTY